MATATSAASQAQISAAVTNIIVEVFKDQHVELNSAYTARYLTRMSPLYWMSILDRCPISLIYLLSPWLHPACLRPHSDLPARKEPRLECTILHQQVRVPREPLCCAPRHAHHSIS